MSPVHNRSLPRLAKAGTAVVALSLAALSACSSVGADNNGASAAKGPDAFGSTADTAQVQDGGTLTMALSAEPDMLDPTLSRSLYSRYVFSTMCEKLYDVNQDAEIVPQLATDLPKTSDGGKTVTIPLRTDAVFSDGTKMDSAAVKTTLERDLTNPQSGRVSELGPISSIETPDASTVVVHFKEPFTPFTAALADRAGMVMSPAALKKYGDNFASHPSCVGPFKFSKRVPQNSIEVVRDPNYYDADKVHLDKIVWRILSDSGIRAANLRSGDVKVADTISPQDVGELSNDPSLSILQSQSLGYQGVTFNVGNVDGVGTPPKPIDRPDAKDARVRQAFEYAIDRQGLVKAVFNNQYDVACSPISPASPYSSDAAQQCRPHDPEKAKQLLKEAGVSLPYKVTMLESNTPDSLRLAQALQSMVKDGGFDLKIQPVEYSSLLDQQDRGDFELLQLGWSGRVDPDANITPFVGTGGSLNVSGYSNPELDKLLDQARQAGDVSTRQDLYGQAVKVMSEDDPIVYLYRQRNITGVSNDVKGVQVFPDGVVRLAFAGLAK
ncbi:ABC transporter substrate-binding protein [Nocardioides panaciterrulae]|uniref:Peptide/nickel transport system substrate-binding protein n=1 Tax=Nocardioides panaciterrulae TaxID=661492 RepID=A0A7Y9JCB8_9ACTN|nr:ABC transporter substrate-binding protein [Nocardioides panaciterrulae]NYD43253.1 peptide/nickel transport system substrate-binding protein [Nocardioides panaciterrulae]